MGGLSLRRTRLTPAMRELASEVSVGADKLIQPLFAVEALDAREAVPALDGVWRDTVESLPIQVEADLAAGVSKFLLFGVPRARADRDFDHSFTASQVAALRRRFGSDAWIAVDVCLCSATTHGHCGILDDAREHVDNDVTVEALARAAAAYAGAGADCVAPSDMMDGRVAAIRSALAGARLDHVAIMSYAAKFHSALYGPFRIAAESAPSGSAGPRDRATYQIDPARPSDALLCALRDEAEGADILMVKPAMPYLDVLKDLAERIARPWAVYQTSGEQAALELLARAGLGDADRLQREAWTAFRRAGADMIISYAARRGRALLGR